MSSIMVFNFDVTVAVERGQVVTALVVVLRAGSIPFIALGFAIAYLSGPNAAVAIANITYLMLAWSAVGMAGESWLASTPWLVAFAAAFVAVAV